MVDQAKIKELEGEMEDFDPESGGESWNPQEAGEYITGEVLSFQKNIGQYDSNLMTLDTAEDGEIGVWVKEVLRSNIKRKNIKPGDLIGVKYAGEKENDQGTFTYQDYGVKVLERSEENKEETKNEEIVPF